MALGGRRSWGLAVAVAHRMPLGDGEDRGRKVEAHSEQNSLTASEV
jgi:hypothetical protein